MSDSNLKKLARANQYRMGRCGELSELQVGQVVRVAGWIDGKRDHGSLLFVDLRDSGGIVQCVLRQGEEHFDTATELRVESVISVTGKVVKRSEANVNPKLATGSVEIQVTELRIISRAQLLPFAIGEAQDYPEEIRLTYRYLDLRRADMQRQMLLRSRIVARLRDLMHEEDFHEFHTPILTATSPEGARDFLVPSRLNPGKFYALPQAPQQFKQLIVISGFERYFQIAPCFRDEDPRADRSPGDFYQLDVEMAFVEQEDVLQTVEKVMTRLFATFDCTPVQQPFPRFTYAEVMARYGSDKPDLRIDLELQDVSSIFRTSKFKLFARAVAGGDKVLAIATPNTAHKPRRFFDELNNWARQNGGAGLGYLIFKDGQAAGPIANNLTADEIEQLRKIAITKGGDSLFFVCGPDDLVYELAGKARLQLGNKLELVRDGYYFCWVTDFPMFFKDATTGQIEFGHNPFTMPQADLVELDSKQPEQILAHQYDLVCNGQELGSGAIRNHNPDNLLKCFTLAGYSPEQTQHAFGALLQALRFGAPPHGGIALGMERIIMVIAKAINLREITLFPLNQQARDLMMGAPTEAAPEQLRELGLRLILDNK